MLLAAIVALDGVLVDLVPARAAAYAEALAAEGLAVRPDALARAARAAADVGDEAALRGALAEDAGPDAADADDVAVVLAVHRAARLFAARLRHGGVTLAPGARAAVDALGARLRLALVTALPRADAQHVLDAAGLAPAFGVVIAGDDRPAVGALGNRGSANPWSAAVGRLAARVTRLTPAAVAALAGTGAGAAAARAAGLRAVLVSPELPDGNTDPGAHARLRTLDGLTPAALACALDLTPHPAPPAPAR